jgi:hypothetical protein
MRLRSVEVEAKWRGLVSEQEQSGKTVVEFCRERGIPRSKLYLWRQRCAGAQAASGFVRVKIAPRVGKKSMATVPSGIEVRLAGGRSVVVEPGFDASHLRALLAVLENEP